uniref:Uncharacterized protein n=1 Tax=Trichuris muris TaxID=70415 RepID=A0A5S6R3V3_TRIMR
MSMTVNFPLVFQQVHEKGDYGSAEEPDLTCNLQIICSVRNSSSAPVSVVYLISGRIVVAFSRIPQRLYRSGALVAGCELQL